MGYQVKDVTDRKVGDQKFDQLKVMPNSELIEQHIKSCELGEEVAIKDDINDYSDLIDILVFIPKEMKEMFIKLHQQSTRRSSNPYELHNNMNSIIEILLGEYLLIRGMDKRVLSFRDIKYDKGKLNQPDVLKFRLTESKAQSSSVVFSKILSNILR